MKLLDTPCPYCHNPQMPIPPKSFRPFGQCPNCGKKSRAVITAQSDGIQLIKYVATAKPSDDPKRVRSVRLSNSEMMAIEQGRLRLVISNSRITVAV
jgi:hypothetical protein